jgi:hypothetical protein
MNTVVQAGVERWASEKWERIDGNRKAIRNMALMGSALLDHVGQEDNERNSRVAQWGHGSDFFALERFGDDDDVWLTVSHGPQHRSFYLLHPQADSQNIPWQHRLITTDGAYVKTLRAELSAYAGGVLQQVCEQRLSDRDRLGINFDGAPMGLHRFSQADNLGQRTYVIGMDDAAYTLTDGTLARLDTTRHAEEDKLGVTTEARLAALLRGIADGEELQEVPPVPEAYARLLNPARNEDSPDTDGTRGPNAIDQMTALRARRLFHEMWRNERGVEWATSSWEGIDMVRGVVRTYRNEELGLQEMPCLIGVRTPRDNSLQLEVAGLRGHRVAYRIRIGMTPATHRMPPHIHGRIDDQQSGGLSVRTIGGAEAAGMMISLMQDLQRALDEDGIEPWDEGQVTFFYQALPWRLQRPPSTRQNAYLA